MTTDITIHPITNIRFEVKATSLERLADQARQRTREIAGDDGGRWALRPGPAVATIGYDGRPIIWTADYEATKVAEVRP